MMRGIAKFAAFGFTLLIALVVGAVAALAQSVPAFKDLKNRTSVAAVNANGYVDSTTLSINGAIGDTGTLDTLVAFGTDDFFWRQSSTPATAYGCARLAIYGGTNTNCDSIFYAIQTSVDGVNFARNATFIALVAGAGGASGDEYISGPIICDTDVVGTTGAGTPCYQRWWRIIIRADGNTAAIWTGAKVRLTYDKLVESY